MSVLDASGFPGATVTLSVEIGDTTGLGILSVEFVLAFDPDILSIANVTKTGTIAESWGGLTYNIVPGQIIAKYTGDFIGKIVDVYKGFADLIIFHTKNSLTGFIVGYLFFNNQFFHFLEFHWKRIRQCQPGKPIKQAGNEYFLRITVIILLDQRHGKSIAGKSDHKLVTFCKK